MRLVVTSRTDIAGENIYNWFRERDEFKEEGEFEDRPILKNDDIMVISTASNQTRAEHLDEYFDPEYYVFASRHRSESGKKTLTVHATGNITSRAEAGGNPRELALANPSAMKEALKELEKIKKQKKLDYEVSMEATHHGPTSLERPLLFVEVGSTEREWRDGDAVEAVAKAAIKAAKNRKSYISGVGLGGNHYCPVHTKFIRETDYAIGHVLPTYTLNDIDFEIFNQAIEKGMAEFFYIDYKSLKSQEKTLIGEFVEKSGLPVKKMSELNQKTDQKPIDIELSLVEEADNADRKEFGGFLKKKGVFIKRDINGKIKGLYSQRELKEDIIRKALKILESKYILSLEENSLRLYREKFDPQKARNLGIRLGPDFSKLARGESLELDGKKITKHMVTKTTRKVIRIEDKGTHRVIEENV